MMNKVRTFWNILKQIGFGVLLASSLLVGSAVNADEPEGVQLILETLKFQDPEFLPVAVSLSDVENLYGVEFEIEYDPTLLEVSDSEDRIDGTQLSVGSLLPSGQNRVIIFNTADNDTGLIKFVATLLNPAPPVNTAETDSPLATIFFKLKAQTESVSVNLTKLKVITADLKQITLAAPQTLSIDISSPEATPAPTTGIFTPPDSVSFQWWVVILGGGGVVIVIVLLLLRPTRPTQPVAMTWRRPTGAPQSGRSSVLLTQRGNEALARQELETAYEYFSQAIELDPANAQAWVGKGLVAEQPNEKKICFQRALSLDPNNVAAQEALAAL